MEKKTYSVYDFMNQFVRVVNKYSIIESQPLDFGTQELLHPSEIHFIEAIGKNKGNTVSELSQNFCITKGAASQMVSKLNKKGYVDKTVSAYSRKEIILTLTLKGKTAFSGHEKFHDEMDREFIEGGSLGQEQLMELKAMLDKMEIHLEKIIHVGRKG